MLKNVDIKIQFFTYICAKNVVIRENVEKCWYLNFYLKMFKCWKMFIL